MSAIRFIGYIPKDDVPQNEERQAQKQRVRAQAARASSDARLETIRKRGGRTGGRRRPGQHVLPARRSGDLQDRTYQAEPLPMMYAVAQHQNQMARDRDREVSATLHAHTFLGGSIPAAQANVAIMGRFVHRFKSAGSSERPWIELILAESSSSPTSASSSLVATALQANATALSANDLQEPGLRSQAAKLYLSTIAQLQSSLKGPTWRESSIMYTCMILTLYECIESDNPSARSAHIRGVAHLIHQKGAQSFICGLEHKTFRYYRINIAMVYLADRRQCFLAEPEWKEVPFSGDCPPKTVSDLLIDILLELPGVLAAVESLREDSPSPYMLLQRAFELAYLVRRLIHDLEKWKEKHIWTYPTICTTPHLRNSDLLALCELCTGVVPYDANLAEVLNCYLAAHLVLARIAQRLAERSFVMRTALRPPHSLRDLITAIVLVSDKTLSAGSHNMISMGFPLKVAAGAAELDEPALFKTVQGLLDRVNDCIARKYNIRYSASSETKAYKV